MKLLRFGWDKVKQQSHSVMFRKTMLTFASSRNQISVSWLKILFVFHRSTLIPPSLLDFSGLCSSSGGSVTMSFQYCHGLVYMVVTWKPCVSLTNAEGVPPALERDAEGSLPSLPCMTCWVSEWVDVKILFLTQSLWCLWLRYVITHKKYFLQTSFIWGQGKKGNVSGKFSTLIRRKQTYTLQYSDSSANLMAMQS